MTEKATKTGANGRGKGRVSLVLSCGGSRGLANIGAIEAIIEAGYEITSVAGASMGALVGAAYATGRLPQVKRWFCLLDNKRIRQLADISLGKDYIVKGDRVMAAFRSMIPDVAIEKLPVKFTAISADLASGGEVVFSSGSLFDAVRASISIPSFFRPVMRGKQVLVDGGVVNPLPLDHARREKADILIAVDVNAPDDINVAKAHRRLQRAMRSKPQPFWQRVLPNFNDSLPFDGKDSNFLSLLNRSYAVMVCKNTALSLEINKPDVLVSIPMNRFGTFDYTHANRIIREGKNSMKAALAAYEAQQRRGFFSRFLLSLRRLFAGICKA